MDFNFTTETITPDATNVLTIGGTGGLEISIGTTAQRPVAAINGTIRYNTDLDRFEVFQGIQWTNYTDALYLPGSTYKTIQNFIDIMGSRGTFTGGEFTDNGDGTIAVSGGTGMIHPVDSTLSRLFFLDFPATPVVPLIDNALNNIFVDYNGGNIRIVAIAGPDFTANKVIIGQVYRSGTTLTINQWTRLKLDNSFVGIINRFQTVNPFQHESGAAISATGTRNFAISDGVFWEGIDRLSYSAKNTATGDTFTYWYRSNPTTWVSVPGQTQINNAQYNNPNTGLANLSNKAFGTHWIYLSSDGGLNVVYGITNTSLVNSQASQPPPNPPNTLLTAVLLGRIIIERNTATFAEISSAFNVVFTGGAVTPHNELGGLQGGTIDEYYHLTFLQNSLVSSLDSLPVGIITKTGVGTFANRTLTAGAGISITNGDGVAGNPTISATGGGGTVTTVTSAAGTTGLTNTITTPTSTPNLTITGTLNAVSGGTGQTVYVIGDILFASTTTALSKLADVATGNALISGGVGAAPSYGKIGLTTHVTGTLPVVNGGTNLTTLGIANQIVGVNTGATAFEYKTVTAGTAISVINAAGSITVGVTTDPVLPGTGSVTLPTGTTAQRPAVPTVGMMRFNTTIGRNETYTGTAWVPSGTVIQQVIGNIPFSNFTPVAGTIIPFDNTAPLSTEGTQIWTQAFTPILATSTIVITSTGFYSTASTTDLYTTVATFNGTTCIGASMVGWTTNTGEGRQFNVITSQVSGSTTVRTYSGRMGPNATQAITINGVPGTPGTAAYGGTANIGRFTIMEISP